MRKIRRTRPDFPCFMLREIDYRGVERVVRINALDTPYWREDIRCAVAGGCDAIRIPKTESARDVKLVENALDFAEREFTRPEKSVLIMAAIESARGVMKALDICELGEAFWNRPVRGRLYQGICRPISREPESN